MLEMSEKWRAAKASAARIVPNRMLPLPNFSVFFSELLSPVWTCPLKTNSSDIPTKTLSKRRFIIIEREVNPARDVFPEVKVAIGITMASKIIQLGSHCRMVLLLNLPMGKCFFRVRYQMSGIARYQRWRIQSNIHEEFVFSVNKWKNTADERMTPPTIISTNAMTESCQLSILEVFTLLKEALSSNSNRHLTQSL